jgi:hypothetical protein
VSLHKSKVIKKNSHIKTDAAAAAAKIIPFGSV